MSLKMATGGFLAVFVCLLGHVLCQQKIKCVVCSDCAKLTCAQANNTMDCMTSCYSQETADGKINRGCYSATSSCVMGAVQGSTMITSMVTSMVTSMAATTAGSPAPSTAAPAGSGSSISLGNGSSATVPSVTTVSATMAASTVIPVVATLCCNTSTCGRAEPLLKTVAATVPDAYCSASSLLPGAWLLTIAVLLAASADLIGIRNRHVPLL